MFWGNTQSVFQLFAATYLAASYFQPFLKRRMEKTISTLKFSEERWHYKDKLMQFCSDADFEERMKVFPDGRWEIYEKQEKAKLLLRKVRDRLENKMNDTDEDAHELFINSVIGVLMSCLFLKISTVSVKIHVTRWLLACVFLVCAIPFLNIYRFIEVAIARSRTFMIKSSKASLWSKKY